MTMFVPHSFVQRLFAPHKWVYRAFIRYPKTIGTTAFVLTLAVYPLFCLLSWLRIGTRKLLGLKPAIVWGPTPIINIVDSSEIMNRLGYRSRTLVYTTYHITSRFDYNLKPYFENPAVNYWLPNVIFLWSLLKFDVFHFFYDGGLWSGMKIVPRARWLELPLLRLAGKRVVAMAYGADVRVREENEKWQPYNGCLECPEPGMHCICNAAIAAENVRYYRNWCNNIIAMGDMSDYVPGSDKTFTHWPIDVRDVAFNPPRPHDGPVRLVHSPNHRHFKGTRFIEAAVENLRRKGYDIELDIVEKVSNVEAKRRYGAADVVVAQCLYGWMGYTEIEAMAAGKPVVTYLRDPAYLDHAPGCPVVSAHPGVLQDKLEELVSRPELREELGRKGRQYVIDYWSYEALAPHYQALHERIWKRNGLLKAVWNRLARCVQRQKKSRRLQETPQGC